MYDQLQNLVLQASTILIIQGENPDGDSLGSALALEEILGDLGKQVHLYCAIEMPKYLRYAAGWDRVSQEFPRQFDLAIIVDTAAQALLEKTLVPENLAQLQKHPLVILDHHQTDSDLTLDYTPIIDPSAVATGELIASAAKALSWQINPSAATSIVIAVMSDSLGLTTETTTLNSAQTIVDMMRLGANLAQIETRRREFNKKPAEILAYKAQLIERITYHLDGRLALVHIPWEDIQKYSDKYNPSVLVLDEMRLVEGVRLAVAIKTYPDGKLTGKIRCNSDAPIGEQVAGYFGGGGHSYAAGFKVHENYDTLLPELISAVDKLLGDPDAQTPQHTVA